jgi:hypothetical protein
MYMYSQWFLPFRFSDQNSVCIMHFYHVWYKVVQIWPGLSAACLHTNQSRSYLNHLVYAQSSSSFDCPNNILWRVQIIKLLIMHFSPASYYFFPIRDKYSLQHSLLNF